MNSNRGNGTKFLLPSASPLLTSTQPLRHFVPVPPDLHFVSLRTPCGSLLGWQKIDAGIRFGLLVLGGGRGKFTGSGKLDPKIRVSDRSVVKE